MRLEDIGFYTLSDERARTASIHGPLSRCELIVTDRCNLRCVYCRGLRPDLKGTLCLDAASWVLDLWIADSLRAVRFSGGEPAYYPYLEDLVVQAREGGVERIAVSTNGTRVVDVYLRLVEAGVNDFSISLDGGCCAVGDAMAGTDGAWERAAEIIRALSPLTYVTVGMVFTEENVDQALDAVLFADSLGPADIRVIPSAQYDRALFTLRKLPEEVLARHPILAYRVGNIRAGRHVRGIAEGDSHRCYLMMDDMAVAGEYHFPCIIYLREGGDPVGRVGQGMRSGRFEWIRTHDTHLDPICRANCLDVCVDYNNRVEETH